MTVDESISSGSSLCLQFFVEPLLSNAWLGGDAAEQASGVPAVMQS